MSTGAFFFYGNSLLVPQGMPISMINREIPLAHAGDFPDSDIFSVPAIDQIIEQNDSGGTITCVSVSIKTVLSPFWRTIPVRQALAEGGYSARMLRAFHLAQWRQESRFCGSCGSPNTDHGEETARLCPACGRVEFPRIAPAVITIITNDEGQALLAHNYKFTAGVYSLIAGFAEAGESLEEAVSREIREEAGIEVSGIRYIASQPWPFPNSLMIGFSARYASGIMRPDGIEIADAGWFSRDNLPKLPGPGSLSSVLIGLWLEGKL